VLHRTIKTLAFSPDGVMLASGGYDNIINVWKFKVRFVRDLKKISKFKTLRINSAGTRHRKYSTDSIDGC
jgi:WD40 repeat protein